jgi:hypothetical protein
MTERRINICMGLSLRQNRQIITQLFLLQVEKLSVCVQRKNRSALESLQFH